MDIFTPLLIALGGAFGALSRYFLVMGAHKLLGFGFPYGTLLVNVVGSIAIGFLSVFLMQRVLDDGPMRALLIIGGLGALTTFSSFSMDTFNLLEGGQFALAGMNILFNVSLCLLAVFLGSQLAKLM